MTNVLVTGGAGYIGSHTCRALAEAGHQPVVLDNLSTGYRRFVRWGPLIEGDIADHELVSNALEEYEIGAVFHFAAKAYVGESVTHPRLYFKNNVASALLLLEAVLDREVPYFIFSSSCAVYGVPQSVPITEDQEERPISPYGLSKQMIERALSWYGRAYGLSWVSLRYFNAAGANSEASLGECHRPETHLIPLAIDAAMDGSRRLPIFGEDYPTPDGTAIRDFVHVDDLADAHIQALDYLAAGGDPLQLNIGTGAGFSVRKVIEQVELVSGVSVPTQAAERRPGDPPELVADPSRAEAVLDWKPRRSTLAEIVNSAWTWHTSDAARTFEHDSETDSGNRDGGK